MNFPISRTSRYRIESKTWGTSYYGGMRHLLRFQRYPMAKTTQYANHSILEGTSYEPELPDFMGLSISD
ncbi:unnamed protein product [Prunus armeniaca]